MLDKYETIIIINQQFIFNTGLLVPMLDKYETT